MKIAEYLENNIKIRERDNIVNLGEAEQRELIVWLWKNRANVVRDIVCDNCPEHWHG